MTDPQTHGAGVLPPDPRSGPAAAPVLTAVWALTAVLAGCNQSRPSACRGGGGCG